MKPLPKPRFTWPRSYLPSDGSALGLYCQFIRIPTHALTVQRNSQPQAYYLAQSQHGFGSSPFLAHAPGGGTLLACPSRKDKTPLPEEETIISWMFQRVYVQHGDARARNFGEASLPWKGLGASTGAFFPSIMIVNNDTVVALASFITLQPDRT